MPSVRTFATNDPPPAVVRLRRGAMLIVSGWIGAPHVVIHEVDVQLARHLDSNSWSRLADGRPCNERIPPGRHAIRLSHRNPDGHDWHSDVVEFEIASDEQKELHLELLPALELVGRLADVVPRPVRNGRVRINAWHGTTARGMRMSRTFDAAVAPDGSFRFEEVPSGAVQLFAQCDGWVVRQVPTRDLDHIGIVVQDEAQWRGLRDESRPIGETYEEYLSAHVDMWLSRYPELAHVLPHFHLEAGLAPLVVEMEPTVTLAVTVLDEAGQPLDRANVVASPKRRWSAISMFEPFQSGDVHATTAADGRAVLAGLPPWSFALSAEREGFELRNEGARDGRWVLHQLGSEAWQQLTLHMGAAAK